MGVGMGAKSLEDRLRDGSFTGSRLAHLLVLGAEFERECRDADEADRVWFENDQRLRADLPWLHERYLAGASYADLAREFAADYGLKHHAFASRLSRRFRSAGLTTRQKANVGWRERVSDDECFDVAARLGIAAAAVELGVSQSAICSRIKDLGWSERFYQARRDNGFAANTTVAKLLNVDPITVGNMVADGRLSDPIDIDAVRSAVACVVLDAYREPLIWGRTAVKRCVGCGSLFNERRGLRGRRIGAGAFCTPECKRKLVGNEHQKLQAQRMLSRATVQIKSPRVKMRKTPLVAGPCCVCSELLVARQQTKHALHCDGCVTEAQRAVRKADRDRRKARQRGAFKTARVHRRKVFERDKWRCHICGKRIDKSLTAPDRGSATLDHIQPLAFGGEHSMHNIKAAHLSCNSARGHRGEFPMMLPLAA
jgi:5-methylcytosine-specific restriction endonuclease McrA